MRKRHGTRYPGIYFRLVDETQPKGDRRYVVWYSDANGVGHTQTLPVGASLEDARLLQGNLQARKADGETLVRTKKTVGELLDTLDEETRQRYAYGIRVLKERIGKRKATELSPSDVANLIRDLKNEGKKTWTVRKIFTPLHGAYRLAVRDGLVGSSPADKLLPAEKPKGDAREKRCLSSDEVEKLLAAASTPRWRTLLSLLVFTGLRISEALALTWDDITEDGVEVRKSKTPSGVRTVILIPDLRARLAEHRLSQPHGTTHVFSKLDGSPMSYKMASTALQSATERAGLPRYTLHELRHTFASILIANGENVVLVSKQMGHKDPGVTLTTYAHWFDAQESADRARDRLQEAMGGMI